MSHADPSASAAVRTQLLSGRVCSLKVGARQDFYLCAARHACTLEGTLVPATLWGLCYLWHRGLAWDMFHAVPKWPGPKHWFRVVRIESQAIPAFQSQCTRLSSRVLYVAHGGQEYRSVPAQWIRKESIGRGFLWSKKTSISCCLKCATMRLWSAGTFDAFCTVPRNGRPAEWLCQESRTAHVCF